MIPARAKRAHTVVILRFISSEGVADDICRESFVTGGSPAAKRAHTAVILRCSPALIWRGAYISGCFIALPPCNDGLNIQ
jgi:hypothetical protein